MKRQHEKELEDQKNEYGKLLREESSKWELKREELEKEIGRLKKLSASSAVNSSFSTPVIRSREQSTAKSQEADLTAIIKDLKESSELLSTSGKQLGKRSNSAMNRNNASNSYLNSKTVRGTMLLPNLGLFLFLETSSN